VTDRPPAVIELRDVTAGYGSREVLRGVSASVGGGERVAVVGPNGAGKSTLLRLMTGVLAPSAGEVCLAGSPVAGLSRVEVARRVAVVPQVAVLPFSASVEEVVALGRIPHEDPLRGPRAADVAAVESAIARVGLEDFVGRDARELSLGERQLVLVGLAVAQAAPIVVLDEPTVHLDIRHQVDVMELLVDLNERDGTTIVAVLHDLALAARYFPRIMVVDGGRLASDGPPAEALSRDRIQDVFRVDPRLLSPPWAIEAPTAASSPRPGDPR
jgi:ABC-type cobalamin/Fe3+-siderophores transport system ATPase subunit